MATQNQIQITGTSPRLGAPPSPKFKNVIWEGRFQPIHRGHLAYIRELLAYGERVWLYVVANETSHDLGLTPDRLPVPEFTEVVDPHHRPEKNPLPYWFRYLVVVETVRAEFGDGPVVVGGGRRLDLGWDLYEKIMPPDRVFITPDRDDFEDVKAAAWRRLQEKNFRINVSHLPKVSATMIRDRVRAGEPVEHLLAARTQELLVEHEYFTRLGDL
ncbi:MAG: hypothetical protein IT349_10085 [Candidatus Eisenbacteria bacterium]|nr:hypothetical protein [Candidatus Eisenbacteria bacterium]